MSKKPFFICDHCDSDYNCHKADDLRVFEGKLICENCHDASDENEIPEDWQDLPKFKPESDVENERLKAMAETAEARVKKLEKALRNIKGMAESDDGDYCMIYDAAKAALRGKVGCKQRPVEKTEDPRDDPITGDDSWVHDPDMGDK